MDYFTRFKRFLLEGFMPVTKAAAILAGIISILCFAFPPLASLFVLNPANFLFRPGQSLLIPGRPGLFLCSSPYLAVVIDVME